MGGEFTVEEQAALVKELEIQTIMYIDSIFQAGGGMGLEGDGHRLRGSSMSEEDLERAEGRIIRYHKEIARIKEILAKKKKLEHEENSDEDGSANSEEEIAKAVKLSQEDEEKRKAAEEKRK